MEGILAKGERRIFGDVGVVVDKEVLDRRELKAAGTDVRVESL